MLSAPSAAVASWLALTAYLPALRTTMLERKAPELPFPFFTATVLEVSLWELRKKVTSTRWPGAKGAIDPITPTLPKIGALPPCRCPTRIFTVALGVARRGRRRQDEQGKQGSGDESPEHRRHSAL